MNGELNLGRSRTRGGFRSVALWQICVNLLSIIYSFKVSCCIFFYFKYSLLSRKRKGAHLQILFYLSPVFSNALLSAVQCFGSITKLMHAFF